MLGGGIGYSENEGEDGSIREVEVCVQKSVTSDYYKVARSCDGQITSPPPGYIPTHLVRHLTTVCAEEEKMHSLVALNYLFLAERTKSLPAAMQSQLRLLSVMQAEQSRAEQSTI